MVSRIDYDFRELEDDEIGHGTIAVRTQVFDRETIGFVERHPRGTIVNLGAGLDTRFYRVDNGKIRWFDVDLPEMIDFRRRFLTESERNFFIARSALDFRWMKAIPMDAPVLLVAEGLLIYLEERDVRALFENIADHFREAEVLLDAVSPSLLGRKMPGIDPDLTPFRWGVYTLRDLEAWDSRIRIDEEWFFQNMASENRDIMAEMFGLMLRPDAKIGRIRITSKG